MPLRVEVTAYESGTPGPHHAISDVVNDVAEILAAAERCAEYVEKRLRFYEGKCL